MSRYYHDFYIGFNIWMAVAPLFIMFAAFVGLKTVNNKNWEKVMNYFSKPAAALFGILLFVESRDGIIQYFDNGLSEGESGVISLFLLIPAIVGASILFLLALEGAYLLAYNLAGNALDTVKKKEKKQIRFYKRVQRDKEDIERNAYYVSLMLLS